MRSADRDARGGVRRRDRRRRERRDGGTNWTLQDAASFGSAALDCPSDLACYTANGFGGISATKNGGSTWTTQLPDDVVTTIECASATTCVADDYGTENSPTPNALTTTHDGHTWHDSGFAPPGLGTGAFSFSCPDELHCYGLSQYGIFATTTGP